MTTNSPPEIPKFKLGLLLFLAGMLGVVALTVTALPQVLDEVDLPVPMWVALLGSIAQTSLLIAVVIWLGVSLAPKVGLSAPAFEAFVSNQSISQALRPQLMPGLVAGLIGGIGLFAIGGYASPIALAGVEPQFTVPLIARVLYGGITEELLLRWGVMTLLVWIAWRFIQRRTGTPKAIYVWLAIILSALLFGAGHLPVVASQVGELTIEVVLFVIGANAVFGVIFGYLFRRYGLEAAIIAHALAHVVSYLFELVAA